MSEEDIFDALDDSTKAASGGNDYADWWEAENQGDTLVGIIVEQHSAPRDWTDAGEVPDVLNTVMSVGRGDLEAGEAATPKSHKQLKQGLEGASIGDLVKLEFTGYQKVEGQPQPMMTYEIGVIPEEQWTELNGADEIQELLDDYDGLSGDNRQTEPYTGGSSSSSSSGSSDTSDEGAAASALKEIVDIQGGEVEVEQAESILAMRDLDVDVEAAALMAGLTVEDGIVSE